MSYCINPYCKKRTANPDDANFCEGCKTPLLLYDGRFRILDKISSRPDYHPWEVFKVKDIDSGKYTVLKTLKKHSNLHTELFTREKEILIESQGYSGIPDYIMYFVIPEEPEEGRKRPRIDCLVMELIDGQDLSRWLEQNTKLTDRNRTIEWLNKIVTILCYLHNKKYWHRDIKPDNIILNTNNELVLIDFGIATEVTTNVREKGACTEARTVYYAAPEQIDKDRPRAYLQSDFFAVGKTFVHLLTGNMPDPGLIKLDEWLYDANAMIETGVIPLIDWLLKEDPLQRPQTAREILKVTSYLNQRNSNGNFPGDTDTEKYIESIRLESLKQKEEILTTSENSPQTTLSGSTNNPPVNGMPPTVVTQPNDSTETRVAVDTTTSQGSKNNRSAGESPQPNPIDKYQLTIWKTIAIAAFTGIACILLTLWILNKKEPGVAPKPSITPAVTPQPVKTVEELMSFGDRDINVYRNQQNNFIGDKSIAFKLFKERKYKEAYQKFYQLRQKNKKDPDLLVYMNNAKVQYWHQKDSTRKIYTIAAVIPASIDKGQHMLYGIAHAQSKVVNLDLDINNIESEPAIYLQVAIVDDGNNPEQAKTIAEKLTRDNAILAVIGHYTSEVTCATMPIYTQAQLPIISPTSTMNELRNRCSDTNQVFVRTASSTQLESAKLIEYLNQHLTRAGLNNPTIVSFYKKAQVNPGETTKEYSEDLFNVFKRDYKNKFDQDLADGFDLSDKVKFRQGIEKMKVANIIILFSDGKTNNPSAFNRAKDVLQQADYARINLILASNPMYSLELGENLLRKWEEKLMVAVDWYGVKTQANSGEDRSRQKKCEIFVGEIDKLWDGDLNRTTAQSYEAVQVLSEIFKQGSDTRLQIIGKLKTISIPSDVFNSKRISFDAKNGDRKDITQRTLLTPAENGKKFIPIGDNNQCP